MTVKIHDPLPRRRRGSTCFQQSDGIKMQQTSKWSYLDPVESFPA